MHGTGPKAPFHTGGLSQVQRKTVLRDPAEAARTTFGFWRLAAIAESRPRCSSSRAVQLHLCPIKWCTIM